ncbi:MAG: TlpA family protein disulfide reductase [Ginsengibacter sp.]|jgi:thiol-disulfide isomerase/thioredoxin
MNLKSIIPIIKKRWASILFYGIIILLIFSPGAKSWLLQQVVSTGLLKAEIKNGAKDLQNAATFSFIDGEGKTSTTADLKGKVVFINFWASWCPPCRAEMPSLENLYQKLKDNSNFVFLFINEDDDRSKGLKYLEANDFTIPFYQASGNVPAEIFSGSLPTTIVLNKKGKVVLKHSGMARYDTQDFMSQLKELE